MPTLSFAAIFASLITVSFAVVPVKQTAIFERLNAPTEMDATLWSVVKDGGTVQIAGVPSLSNQSVELKRAQTDGPLSATRNFDPLTGRVVVEARVMTGDTTGIKNLPSVLDSQGRPVLTVSFNEGNIVYSDGADKPVAQPFNAGEWYVIRAEIDLKSGTYDLYVDALKKAHGAKLQTGVTDVAKVAFTVDQGNSVHFDNLMVYAHAVLIGAPPAPVFDVTKYGAVGDGKTLNTKAIQKAIDACTGSGGSVYIPPGTFVTGSLTLKNRMTLFLDPAATLLGSDNDGDYPRQTIENFKNGAVGGLKKALIFANGAKDLTIDGGGTIDGNGGIPQWRMNGHENLRPFLLFPVRCENLTVRNVYLKDAGMWCFVPTECNRVTISNIYIDSRDYGNRDGIDPVDSNHVLIQYCTINSDDDNICPKSGIKAGLTDVHVHDCNLMQSVRANGIKFGTGSYGGLKDAIFEDIMIKNTDKSAIALEAVDGADIQNITFRRIQITDCNSPFYLIIGTRSHGPSGDSRKIGSIKTVLFEDITARDLKYNLGCPISGNIVKGHRYAITDLTFRRCDMVFKGGYDQIPGTPPEMGKQYPECNVWGELPAYGYFIRHADNVQFIDCKISAEPADSRQPMVTIDVKNLTEK